MDLADRLAQERRARLAAERLLELKQAELSAANRRLGQHAQTLIQRVHETKAETARVRDDLSAANEKAEIAERRILSSVQTLRSGFAIFDMGGRLVFANAAYLSVFEGIEEVRPGIEYARILQIMTEEGLVNTGDQRPDAWRRKLAGNFERQKPWVLTMQLWDERHLKLSFKRTVTGDVVNLVDDITESVRHAEELTEARRRAEAANRAKSAFLANMSHEIRTPMNGVVGMAELLGDTGLTEEQKLYVDTIHNSAEALLVIINDVLDYSKIEAQRLTLSPEPFDLERCVHEVTTMLQPSAHDKDVKLLVDYDLFLPTRFEGDPGRIRQVLTNILGNAVKFTPEGHVLTRVTGHVDEAGRASVHVAVEDTGIGIAPDMVEHIWGEFNQVEDERNRQFEGTGLGLAITRKLVDLMGGHIWVESEVGAGSCFGFSLTLPVVGERESAPIQLARGLHRIMVVDDHPVNRDILDRQLTKLGAEVRSFASAAAALAERDFVPDLVVTDHHMPDKTGIELAEDLRAGGVTAPIFLLSSNPSFAENDPARGHLAAVLQKPVPRNVLFDHLRRIGADVPAGLGVAPPPADPPPPVPLASSGPLRRMKVLAAEDNRTNRLVFDKMVSRFDIEVRYANDGAEAVESALADPPDLIFMDISMPRMDGKTATARIREAEAGTDRHVPIIALTAHAMTDDRDEILAAGLDDYLTKPLRKEALMRIITAHAPKGVRPPFGEAAVDGDAPAARLAQAGSG